MDHQESTFKPTLAGSHSGDLSFPKHWSIGPFEVDYERDIWVIEIEAPGFLRNRRLIFRGDKKLWSVEITGTWICPIFFGLREHDIKIRDARRKERESLLVLISGVMRPLRPIGFEDVGPKRLPIEEPFADDLFDSDPPQARVVSLDHHRKKA